MTTRKRINDPDVDVASLRETNGNGAINSILIAVICSFIVGMGTYIFNRGITTNENLAKACTEIEVLKSTTTAMKIDMKDMKEDTEQIKIIVTEVRMDQIRRQKLGK